MPWSKIAELLRGAGDSMSAKQLQDGHSQLKATVSDLLIWFNGASVWE